MDLKYTASTIDWERVDNILRYAFLITIYMSPYLVQCLNFIIKHHVVLTCFDDHLTSVIFVSLHILNTVNAPEATLSKDLIYLVLFLKDRALKLINFWNLAFVVHHV